MSFRLIFIKDLLDGGMQRGILLMQTLGHILMYCAFANGKMCGYRSDGRTVCDEIFSQDLTSLFPSSSHNLPLPKISTVKNGAIRCYNI